jgi:SAM-dependent methyltransferase
MDAHIKRIPTLREPSSELAFGLWALEKPDGTDAIAAKNFFAPALITENQTELLREAHRRLLPRGPITILDLCAGDKSHVPTGDGPVIIGLAKNRRDTESNRSLTQSIAFNPNSELPLPFPDGYFDAVVLSENVGLLRRPVEIFREVSRVLRPEGLFAVTFLQPSYTSDLTRMWALGDDPDHLVLVDSFFEYSRGFLKAETVTLFRDQGKIDWESGGIGAPPGTEHYVHLVWAYKDRRPANYETNPPFQRRLPLPAKDKKDVVLDETGRPTCPYCGEKMNEYAPPVTVFEIDYGVEKLHVCFHNDCPYYKRSKRWMRAQGSPGYTYRFMRNPETGAIGPIPDDLVGGLASGRLQ